MRTSSQISSMCFLQEFFSSSITCHKTAEKSACEKLVRTLALFFLRRKKLVFLHWRLNPNSVFPHVFNLSLHHLLDYHNVKEYQSRRSIIGLLFQSRMGNPYCYSSFYRSQICDHHCRQHSLNFHAQLRLFYCSAWFPFSKKDRKRFVWSSRRVSRLGGGGWKLWSLGHAIESRLKPRAKKSHQA